MLIPVRDVLQPCVGLPKIVSRTGAFFRNASGIIRFNKSAESVSRTLALR